MNLPFVPLTRFDNIFMIIILLPLINIVIIFVMRIKQGHYRALGPQEAPFQALNFIQILDVFLV